MPSKIRGGTKDKHLADTHIPRVSALGAGGGAAPAFAPSSISGLQLWLKRGAGLYQERTGASATTPAAAAADPIGTWLDQTVNANHFVATADSTRLTYRAAEYGVYPSAQGDGTDDFLQKTSWTFTGMGNGNYTIFFVCKANSTTRSIFHLRRASGNGFIVCYSNVAGKQRFNQKNDANTQEISAGTWDVTAPTTAYYYSVITRNGDNFTQRINGSVPAGGTATASIDTTTIQNTYLMSNSGAATFNNGYLVEFGIYDSAVAGADLTSLETYLAGMT